MGSMNRLSSSDRARILQLLCEGMSIRAIERTTGASKHTIIRLLNMAGAVLGAYQDHVFRDLSCKRVQVDEIWSFCYSKELHAKRLKDRPEGIGDVWTWTAIDADTKLVFSVLVGGRDSNYALGFLEDINSRVSGRFQLTSDGWQAYDSAVRWTFGDEIDYAKLVKIYGAPVNVGPARYSPPVCIGAKATVVRGDPDPAHISTSYVERHNLTMRMDMRRLTRLTNAFSKKLDNHANAIALHFAYYNFVRIHKTLKTSPAMAAGVADHLWEMSDLVAVVEAAERKPGKRGPYKKRAGANA